MDEFEIIERTSRDAINFWEMLLNVPLAIGTHENLLGVCLQGTVKLLEFTQNGATIGMLMYSALTPGTFFIEALYLPNNVLNLMPQVLEWIRSRGFKVVKAVSLHGPDIMKRVLSGAVTLRTTYIYEGDV